MTTLKEKIKSQQYSKYKINDIEFTLKKMDALEFQRLASKIKGGNSDFEIEIILNSIKDVKWLKTKDVIDSEEGFTAEELDEELGFDLEYVQIFLGKNQEILVNLYSETVKDFIKYTEDKSKKKVN